MKNLLNLKGLFGNSHLPVGLTKLLSLFFLLTLGVGQMWAWDKHIYSGNVFYFKPSDVWKADNARFAVAFGHDDDTYYWYSCQPVEGETDLYYVVSNGDYQWMIFCRMKNGSDAERENKWDNRWNESQRVEPNSNYNRFDLKANWATDFDWYKYAPQISSASIDKYSMTIYGGGGTEEEPYLVATGATIQVQASATSYVSDTYAKKYTFYKKEGTGSRSQWGDARVDGTTKSFTASSSEGVVYAIDVEVENEYYGTYSTATKKSNTVYFQTIDPISAVLGEFNSWTPSSTYNFSGPVGNVYTASFTINKGSYKFKAVIDGGYYGNGQTYSRGSSSPSNTLSTDGGDMTINADVTGNYTFTFNFSAKTLSVTYPNKYTVTTGAYPSVAASAPTISPALEDGYLAEGTSVTLTKQTANTGYTWKEWNAGSTGAGSSLGTGNTYTTTLSGNLAAYAIYTANTYSVVFNKNHEGATGSMSNQAFTYAVAQNLTANAFVRDGYHFDGWATTSDGNVVYTDGQSVSNLTSDNNGTFNLYAHWTKSELTGISLSPAYAVQDEHPGITITPSVSPAPTGTTSICWGLYSDSGCTDEVDGVTFSPDPSSGANTVTFTAPDAAETYYIKADFRAGSTCSGTILNSVTQSFIVHPTHTVTVKAKVGEALIPDAEYNQTSNTVTANTTRPTAVAAPTIPGYTFEDWTLGANITQTSGELTANPISITATAASTLTANYTYTSYTVTYPDEATAHCVFSGKSTSVPYKSTGSFTVVPAAGYTIAVTAADASGSVSLSKNGNLYSFVQGTSAVTITVTPTELTNTVTIVNGTETGGSATEVTAKASSATASVTANAAPTGKKFAYWAIDDAISITSGSTTTRSITFNATRNTTITAVYTNRDSKTVHFAKPFGWSTVTAKFYQDATPKTGEVTHTSTMTYEGANYYTFTYYTDNNGEGDDKSAQANWNKVVFSDNGSNAISAISITDGYYYAKGTGERTGRATPFAEWYLRGYLNGSDNWTSGDLYKYPFEVEGTSATYAYGASTGDAQYFRIYRVSTDQWFRTSSSNSNADITLESSATLQENSNAADVISTNTSDKLGAYVFTLTNINTAAPSLTITHPADTKYTVGSITAGEHGTISSATAAITELGRYMPTDISATANAGYRFKEWVATGGVVVEDPTSASTRATATADGGTLTATFTNEGIVYLDLSAITGWESRTPTVYFYSGSYWDKDKGSGSKNILYGGERMTQIGGTHVWYYDYSGTSMGIGGTKNYIAFTDQEQDGSDNFSSCSAIYRGDFYPEMNMFVPQNSYVHKNTSAAYYNNGYWMKYNDAEAGYRLRIYDGQGLNLQQTIPFITATPGSRDTYEATFHVSGAADAKFELVGYDQGTVNGVSYAGTFYGNTGSINSNLDSWWYFEPDKGKTNIKLISNGDYVFKLKCETDGKLYAKVSYPLATGDFRIKYNGLRTTKDAEKTNVYSDVIPRLTEDGTRLDTVSFFVHNSGGKTATLSAEKVLSIASNGTITWVTSDVSLTGADISSLATDVYTFKITQTKSGATHTLSYESLGAYTGNYYVRTDYANGGWVAYKQADNTLRPTNYAGAGYNAYFCRYIPSGSVKFCIANQYNSALTEEKIGDINANASGTIQQAANTRFEYDTTTNVVSRSYIGGSNVSTYLYFEKASGDVTTIGGTAITTAPFVDQENWIYMLEVNSKPNATYQLKAVINSNTQYFDGTQTAQTLVGGSGDSYQRMRLVYDFKNNHLIKAWMPTVAVNGEIAINADVMLIRNGQNAANELNFSTAGSKLTDVKNIYGVLQIAKSDQTSGTKTSTEKSLYWISFPFDVKLKDMFGFGKFGEDYIIRRYNGAKRARIGWFAETDTFWETMDPDSDAEEENTMQAYEGYLVALDKGLQNGGDTRWSADGNPISDLYLYFPSTTTVGELSQTDKTITLDAIPCGINRTFAQDADKALKRNHMTTDSNWRVVGVGSLHNSELTATTLDGTSTTFDFYEWTPSSNALTVRTGSGYTFKASHAVLAQWAGKITWTGASVPASVAARRVETEKKNYSVELDLNYNGEMADRTYVIMNENASSDFVLNEDLYKATNANLPNIYAYAGAYDCGISRIPIENTTVPVGVITRKRGTYTFSMPSDFSGTATLVDSFAQTRTNLALEDYTVDLEKGTFNERFFLELDIKTVSTNLDQTSDGFSKDKTRKVMIDGILYIVKDGKMYDARGNKVK